MNIETQQRTSAETWKQFYAATRPHQRGAVTTFMVGRSVVGILAVIAFPERRFHTLLSPDFVPSPLGMLPEKDVPFRKMAVNGSFGGGHVRVITVVDYSSGHATEHRFDDV
jgi:hypothetical protein